MSNIHKFAVQNMVSQKHNNIFLFFYEHMQLKFKTNSQLYKNGKINVYRKRDIRWMY